MLTEKEFFDAVYLLKPNKGNGVDDVNSNVIIKSIPYIKTPLLHIFTLSLEQGIFPDKLKVARVIPIRKSGDETNANNILYSKQFGFKKRHSTDQAIVHLVHDIFKSFDEDKYTLGVFIDLSKTTNMNIACGVPQGSILGPLLFLIYINDISNACTELDTILFADDTNLFYARNDINILFKLVNKELLNLTEWFNANKLSLNVTKTKYTFLHRFHNRDKVPLKLSKFCIANQDIKRETTLNSVNFQENVTFIASEEKLQS
ncbi:uncharacterized protein LOC136095207 [Hydra vulgaris]|uniref:uncharacterized protein LOC136095207 n=1 Tax=Hydra vulgaris TaxID=6087 RepID=UPI0032EA31B2